MSEGLTRNFHDRWAGGKRQHFGLRHEHGEAVEASARLSGKPTQYLNSEDERAAVAPTDEEETTGGLHVSKHAAM